MSPPPAGDSRRRILEAAASVAAEHGYEGATIARITERCGLPASSVYWFFDDKDQLLSEVVLHQFETWLQHGPRRRPLRPGEDVVEALRDGLRPGLLALGESPDHLRLGMSLLLEDRERGSTARARFLALREQTQAVFSDWFAEALSRSGAPDAGLASELAQVVAVASDGLLLSLRAEGPADPEEFLDLLVAVLAEALRSASPSPGSGLR